MKNFSESNIQASLTTYELTDLIKQAPPITQKAELTSAWFLYVLCCQRAVCV